MENRINMLDEKMQLSNNLDEECNVQFPISTFVELMHFEKQLKNIKFKNQVAHMFIILLFLYYIFIMMRLLYIRIILLYI